MANQLNETSTNVTDLHPAFVLKEIAKKEGLQVEDFKFAQLMDQNDSLRDFRDEFYYPKNNELYYVDLSLVNGLDECVYMAGNSHGLCPKKTKNYTDAQIDIWSKRGVQGHHTGEIPWTLCGEVLEPEMANIVGCERNEVAMANSLTVNLHLLMISFYRPTEKRYKILCEDSLFCSDFFALESQAKLYDRKPEDVMIYLKPREGEFSLRTEDILATIEKEGDQIAVVFFSGVQYYTGQYFDIPSITKAGQRKGCYVGWDLAHAVGNVPLYLHHWGVDFACWCTYKFLSGGPGSPGGLFVHQKHHDSELHRLQGWFSCTNSSRYTFDKNTMVKSLGAGAFVISNPAVLSCAPLKAGLEIFQRANMEKIREKSLLLTGYLEHLINKSYYKRPDVERNMDQVYVTILTPSDPKQRGAHLSLSFNVRMEKLHQELIKRGVVCDLRHSRAFRVAPSPLYCRFEDVFKFVRILKEAISVVKE